MGAAEEKIDAELERLMSEVRSERPSSPEPRSEISTELVVASEQELAPTEPGALAEPRPYSVADHVFGYSFGERFRVMAAFGAGLTIASAASGIMMAAALATLGYGTYSFLRWRGEVNERDQPIDVDPRVR